MRVNRGAVERPATLDELDGRIIAALQADGRAKFRQLAVALGSAPGAIRQYVTFVPSCPAATSPPSPVAAIWTSLAPTGSVAWSVSTDSLPSRATFHTALAGFDPESVMVPGAGPKFGSPGAVTSPNL